MVGPIAALGIGRHSSDYEVRRSLKTMRKGLSLAAGWGTDGDDTDGARDDHLLGGD